MDDMVNIFMKNREDIWRFDILLEIREESKNLENTHKFFF